MEHCRPRNIVVLPLFGPNCRSGLLALAALALLTLFYPPHSIAADTTAATQVEAGSYLGAMDTEYPDWFKTSFLELEDDILEAQEAGKRLMLVFHQPGCPYCNYFIERNLAQKDIENTVRDNFDAIEINIYGDREVTSVSGGEFTEKTFARELNVQFTPTVLMFDATGGLALRINGYFPPDKFRHALDYVLNENTAAQSFTEYLANQPESIAANTSTQTVAKHAYIDSDDFNTSDAQALPGSDNDQPYILLFEQHDCSNCKLLHDNVFTRDASHKLLSQFSVIRINMWGKDPITLRDGKTVTGKQLAQQLGVSYAPTMVLYAADHTEVIRSESWLKRFHTQSILDYVQSGAWQQQPNFQRYLTARTDAIRERGGSVNIFD